MREHTKFTAVVLTATLAGGIYVGSVVSSASHPVQQVTPIAPTQQVVTIDEQAVIDALKSKGQIVSLTGKVSKKVTMKADKWYGDKTVELTAKGSFKLGVDTADLVITTKGNTVTVRFPQPKVISVDMPFDKAVIAKDVGMLRKELSDAELQSLYGKAREGAVADIKRDRQAFDQAEDSLTQIMERLIAPIDGVEDIDFYELPND